MFFVKPAKFGFTIEVLFIILLNNIVLTTLADLGLLSLNNVVSALGDPRRNVSCIPYQDSLLSRLLREALGGSSLTVAVCTLSPLERDADETANTLMYASRMANIRNR